MKDSKAVKLIALAYDEGRSRGFSEGFDCAREEYKETLAQAKSQAYEAGYAKTQEEAHKVGYQRGLAEGQARGSGSENGYNSGLEAGVKAERERALAAEPKLSVWFMPCGKNEFGMQDGVPVVIPKLYSPAKIDGIRAIREAYGSGEGYSLRDMKDLVETEPGTHVVCGLPLPQSKAVALYLALSAAGFDTVLKV